MDFGDILAQFDKIQAEERKAKKSAPQQGGRQASRKKANAPTKEEKEAARLAALSREDLAELQMLRDKERKINPMELWLRRYGTVDKDREIEEFSERQKHSSREYLRQMRPEARLDLHGLTRDEAWQRMQSFVGDCVRRGLKKNPLRARQGTPLARQRPRAGPAGAPLHRAGQASWSLRPPRPRPRRRRRDMGDNQGNVGASGGKRGKAQIITKANRAFYAQTPPFML